MLPLEFSSLDNSPPGQNGGLKSPENDERDDECQAARVEVKTDRVRVYRRHAAAESGVTDRGFVHDVGEVWEARAVNVHRERDDQGHDPGQGNHRGDGGHLPLGGVLEGVEDGVAPVQADPDQAVDARRAKCDVRGDEGLTRGQAPHPAPFLNILLLWILFYCRSVPSSDQKT